MKSLQTHRPLSHNERNFSCDKIFVKNDCTRNLQEDIRNKISVNVRSKNESQKKKNYDMSSSLHRTDFYDENLKVNKSERPVKTYEIKNADKLDLKEIGNIFAEKGVHIYGVKSSCNFANGNIKNNIVFNIRESENIENKIDSIKSKLDKFGCNLKQKESNTTRTPYIYI